MTPGIVKVHGLSIASISSNSIALEETTWQNADVSGGTPCSVRRPQRPEKP